MIRSYGRRVRKIPDGPSTLTAETSKESNGDKCLENNALTVRPEPRVSVTTVGQSVLCARRCPERPPRVPSRVKNGWKNMRRLWGLDCMCQSPHAQDTAQRPKFWESVLPGNTTTQDKVPHHRNIDRGSPFLWADGYIQFFIRFSSDLSSDFPSDFSSDFYPVSSSNFPSDFLMSFI